MFLQLLLCTSLMIVLVFSIDYEIANITDTYQQSSFLYPKQYHITLTSNIKENIFDGIYFIHIEIQLDIFKIRLINLDIRHVIKIVVTKDDKSFNYDPDMLIIYKPIKILYDNERNITEFIFKEHFLPGHYIIKLIYNIIGTGLQRFYQRNERQWLATYVGTQDIIPRLLETSPTLPIYNIIIEHYQNYTVLTDIPTQKIEINDKKMKMTYFNATVLRPKYFFFLINPMQLYYRMSVTYKNIKVDMWCILSCADTHIFAAKITAYLYDKWTRSDTWLINHVAIFNFQNESIINLDLILYREADITYIKKVDSVAINIKVAQFIAHKVVHEWFYYENPLWLSSSWINEAAAVFLSLYVIDTVFSETWMTELFVVQFQRESLHFDTEYNTSLYNTSFNNSFEHPFNYTQGFSVLRMLQQLTNEETVLKIIRKHVKDYKPIMDYFPSVMKNESYKQMLAKNYSMMQIINSWIVPKYCPVLKVIRDYNNDYDNVEAINVSISHDLNKVLDYDITYTTQMYYYTHSVSVTTPDNLLFRIIHLHHYTEDGWVLFNIQQTGYYRVNYDIENWRRIANYLNSKLYIKIHVLNRAQIIDDAFHLMITHQVKSIVFWNITKYLSRETDYLAWYPMFKAIEYLSNIFLFPEKIYFNIKVITNIVNNVDSDVLNRLKCFKHIKY